MQHSKFVRQTPCPRPVEKPYQKAGRLPFSLIFLTLMCLPVETVGSDRLPWEPPGPPGALELPLITGATVRDVSTFLQKTSGENDFAEIRGKTISDRMPTSFFPHVFDPNVSPGRNCRLRSPPPGASRGPWRPRFWGPPPRTSQK